MAPESIENVQNSLSDHTTGVPWTMTSTEVHTPLEMLILFQTLNSYQAEPSIFTKVSESMKNNTLIKESESFESTRLEPDILENLYLRVMKDEVKAEANKTGKAGSEKDGQHNPRKRKLSSPLLQTIDEASLHAHLLPPLLNRLYFRYRDHAIRAIQDEERKYRLLEQDMQDIKQGERDDRLSHQENSSKRESDGVTSIQTLLRHDSEAERPQTEEVKPQADEVRPTTRSPQLQPSQATAPAAQTPISPQEDQVEQTEAAAKLRSRSPEKVDRTDMETVSQPPISTRPASPQAPETLAPPLSVPGGSQQASTASDLGPRPQFVPSDNNLPFLPPRQLPSPSYPLVPPKLDVNNRRLPLPPNPPVAGTTSSISPHTNQPALPPQDRSSQSPIILPPPPAMLRSSGSPPGSLEALADMAGHQLRTTTALQSPRLVQTPGGPPPIQLPQPRNFPHPAYPYYDSQPTYGVTYQPYLQGHMPPYHHPNQAGGSVGSAYQGTSPTQGRSQIYSNVPLYHSPSPSYSQYPTYPQQPPYYSTPVQTQSNRTQIPKFADQRTPVLDSSTRNKPPKPSPIDTSVSATKWKPLTVSEKVGSPRSPTRPGPDEISPISERASSPIAEVQGHQSNTPRLARTTRARGGSLRGNRSKGRGARAASAASSTVAGSIQSHGERLSTEGLNDELSIDNQNQPSGSEIKPEPPATPARVDDTSISESLADEASRKSTRRRRGITRGPEMLETSRTGTKRKRDEPQGNPPTSPSFPTNRNSQILASRNFPRTSSTLMNDISGHKLASMFAKPLTEREAPGYKDLIYRPQDLKSIKSAIIAGGKALASAIDSSGLDGAGSPAQFGTSTPSAKGSSSNWIAATPEVVPPKGIVNSAQLEKELMRMFANAIMFNPDPKRGVGSAFRKRRTRRHMGTSSVDGDDRGNEDLQPVEEDEEDGGVVTDTREMFEAVERSVEHWRAAERAAERTVEGFNSVGKVRQVEKQEDQDVDELAVEDVDEGVAKRRRK